MLSEKKISSTTGKERWTIKAIDKLLLNKKYTSIVETEVYLSAQFAKEHRCNNDYDKADSHRKTARYQSPVL